MIVRIEAASGREGGSSRDPPAVRCARWRSPANVWVFTVTMAVSPRALASWLPLRVVPAGGTVDIGAAESCLVSSRPIP